MRTSNHSTLKDIAMTRILKELEKVNEMKIFISSPPAHQDPVIAVQCALYDLCSAMQNTFFTWKDLNQPLYFWHVRNNFPIPGLSF